MIMIVRHAEKPADDRPGVRPSGEHDRHSLSVQGWTRAGALVGLFAPQHGEPPTGLVQPEEIYATGHEGGGSRRPVQTVTPLADRLGLDVHHHLLIGQEAELASRLTAHGRSALVAWHHEAIPNLVRAIGAAKFPTAWPDDRYDVVWTLAPDGTGWRFAQVPQLLLAGDRPEPIA